MVLVRGSRPRPFNGASLKEINIIIGRRHDLAKFLDGRHVLLFLCIFYLTS